MEFCTYLIAILAFAVEFKVFADLSSELVHVRSARGEIIVDV